MHAYTEEAEMTKAKPVWKRDWFWLVAMPTVLVAVAFVAAFISRALT